MLNEAEKLELEIFAEEIRIHLLRAIASAKEGHVGGSLSIADLLAALYGRYLRGGRAVAGDTARDTVVLSKGHCGPALYAALALKDYYPMAWLSTLNRLGTHLPSHCDMNRTPGVDMTTGSLGQGASTAAGLALGSRLLGLDAVTYLILGDGECNEGQVWEMAMFARHLRLSNLIAFVDCNGQQLDGWCKDIMDMGDLKSKFLAFGWQAVSVDGHDMAQICAAIELSLLNIDTPSAIVLRTRKGRGFSLAEQRVPSHYMPLPPEAMEQAERESAARMGVLKRRLAAATFRGEESG